MNAKHSSIVEDLNIKIESLIRKNKILTESEEILTLETAHLKSTISKMSVDNLSLESQFAALKIQNTESLAKIQSQALQISENTETISSKNIVIEALECKIRNEEAIRRSLHNTIQELKGNIRVFCRIRPPLASEPTGTSHMQLSENNIELIQSLDSATGKSISKSYPFSFDKVFSNEDQETVFEEISQLVQSALDGYNVCVFAYGQTGNFHLIF